MPVDYQQLMALRSTDERVVYSDQDTMLYALAVGMGSDPLDRRQLPYVYEGAGLKAMPTLASTLAGLRFMDGCGWDYSRILHGEERLTLHRPLASTDTLLIDSEVEAVYDKGAGKGALICLQSHARAASDDQAVFTTRRVIVARGDGGFDGPQGSPPRPHPLPSRSADFSCSISTRPDQALLFRLCGDRNPLHADPQLADRLGFPAPILHGLCTFGIACRAVLETICEYDHTLITGFDVRFSAPVIPGETIITDMWQEANIVSFQSRVAERNMVILDHGRCTLAV